MELCKLSIIQQVIFLFFEFSQDLEPPNEIARAVVHLLAKAFLGEVTRFHSAFVTYITNVYVS